KRSREQIPQIFSAVSALGRLGLSLGVSVAHEHVVIEWLSNVGQGASPTQVRARLVSRTDPCRVSRADPCRREYTTILGGSRRFFLAKRSLRKSTTSTRPRYSSRGVRSDVRAPITTT